MPDISRAVINALLPQGKFWEPETDSDYDKLLQGMADNSDTVISDLRKLAYLRDPDNTIMLEDLEREYGIIPASLATESERRSRLKAFIYRRATTGAWDIVQEKLRAAGFIDVYVHPNDPSVDPDIFLAQAFDMMCGELLPGGNDAQCGEPEAQCSQVGGELLVNGDLFESILNYSVLCDDGIFAGDDVYAGDFDGYKSSQTDATYIVPGDSGYWPLIFFVGGAATRDINGYITEILMYSVPAERRVEFRRLILKFKPMHSWGALIVQYS